MMQELAPISKGEWNKLRLLNSHFHTYIFEREGLYLEVRPI